VEVPILKQGHYLIASIQSALTDADLSQLREALIERVGRFRARGVIVDVTALDVMDSFAVRTLRDIEEGLAFLDRQTQLRIERGSGRIDRG
jgi:rsbT antagonist protein RsbS